MRSNSSGRIEITSKTIADFGYDDCLPHPAGSSQVNGLAVTAPRAGHYI